MKFLVDTTSAYSRVTQFPIIVEVTMKQVDIISLSISGHEVCSFIRHTNHVTECNTKI